MRWGFQNLANPVFVRQEGASVFTYHAQAPGAVWGTGVRALNRENPWGRPPLRPNSIYPVTGLHFYDNQQMRRDQTFVLSSWRKLAITRPLRRFLVQGLIKMGATGQKYAAWLMSSRGGGGCAALLRKIVGSEVACSEENAYGRI